MSKVREKWFEVLILLCFAHFCISQCFEHRNKCFEMPGITGPRGYAGLKVSREKHLKRFQTFAGLNQSLFLLNCQDICLLTGQERRQWWTWDERLER